MAYGANEVHVKGLRELNVALRRADRDVRLGVRKSLREVAEPVRAEAERLAGTEIRNIEPADGGPDWRKMRVGITKDVVYVAPRQRGSKRGLQKRPNLAPLLMDRAMQPALDNNVADIEHRFDLMLETVADRFGT